MRYVLGEYAAAHFGDIPDRKQREHAAETDLVHLFFGRRNDGLFIEVGANEPCRHSQTWSLEQAGWHGLLIEPSPSLCEQLRNQRRRSRVLEVACGAPGAPPRARFHLAENPLHSSLATGRTDFAPKIDRSIEVDVKTLDQIIKETDTHDIDFISIDVEGLQYEVLQGLTLTTHRPRLLLVEDHLTGYRTHRWISRQGYRLVKRTGLNSWYVPADASFVLTDRSERSALWRKVWLRTPVRGLRAALRTRAGCVH